MIVEKVIRNGIIVTPENGEQQLDLLIGNGKIVGHAERGLELSGVEKIDATGLHVLPGGIDPHTHVGFYQDRQKDYFSETSAAAQGGITTIINYLMGGESFHTIFLAHLEAGQNASVVDFSFHFAFNNNTHLAEIESYVKQYGITSFKVLLQWKGQEKPRYNSNRPVDDGFLYELLKKSASLGDNLRVCVHCQNVDLSYPRFFAKYPEKLLDSEYLHRVWLGLEELEFRDDVEIGTGLQFWETLDPGYSESVAVHQALYLAKLTGASAYFVHLSARETAQLLAETDLKEVNCFAETCPHNLALTVDAEAGPLARWIPPIRYAEDREALWEAVRKGDIHTVGSDHAAITRERKLRSSKILNVRFAGDDLSTFLPILLTTGFHERKVPLKKLVEAYSTNTACIFGLYPQKGTLAVGSDADIVLVDLHKEQTVHVENLLGSSDFSVYAGMKLRGWPTQTLIRGQTVYSDGEIVQEPGYGQFLPREAK